MPAHLYCDLRHGTSHHHGLKPDPIGSDWPNSILVRNGNLPPRPQALCGWSLAVCGIDKLTDATAFLKKFSDLLSPELQQRF